MGCMDQKSKTTQTSGLTGTQTQAGESLLNKVTPYIGKGTLGGLSDLEQQALNYLGGAALGGPLASTSIGLLTGALGAQPISLAEANKYWQNIENKALQYEKDIAMPARQEALAGPGYNSSARIESQLTGYGPTGRQSLASWLGQGYEDYMTGINAANRNIQNLSANRALATLNAAPSAVGGWANTLFGMGGLGREIENAINSPEVFQTIMAMLGKPMGVSTGRSTTAPSQFDMWSSIGQRGANVLGLLGL